MGSRNKTPCSIPSCRGWAIRGSDPPRCSPHSARTGAPPTNQNRLVHGFYASVLRPEDLAGLTDDDGRDCLDAKVAIVRLALRRVLSMLVTGTTPGSNPQPLTAADCARFIGLTFHGAGVLSRLLRASRALSPGLSDPLAAAINEALDEIGREYGIEL